MAQLKGKKLEERLQNFLIWQETIQERLKVLTINSNLDFSPDSLNLIEQKILENYMDPMEALSFDKEVISDMIGTYIGEVFIKNLPIKVEWKVATETSSEYSNAYNFIYYLGSNGGFTGFNPFLNIVLFVINKRSGSALIEFYYKIRNSVVSKLIIEPQENKISVPINGFAYQTYLLFKNDAVTLNDIEQSLIDYSNKKNASFQYYGDNHLVLSLDKGYNFHFDLDKRPEVIEESRELSQSLNTPDLALCNSRIEFWGDEDPDVCFMNESLFILERLNPLPVIFLF